ncbi:uncharacterized protein OCT59_008682 [Rhizophagus irregularis]|uniref:uncharacterized protein n=1 Tax=Rhizophagus irregularis TaxID=588596 RepID=UPI001A05900E|nr:hypothetical protein OCT59_008682 [Rhizophagus irregularis]GET61217.1 hypothetical protein RIR_jg22145.t1 [Rhizophagus irregularis DAOM 181602=DAOM 197198]CAB5186388.1 unnamed protein product [Rhizophagus irregularis]
MKLTLVLLIFSAFLSLVIISQAAPTNFNKREISFFYPRDKNAVNGADPSDPRNGGKVKGADPSDPRNGGKVKGADPSDPRNKIKGV